MVSPTGSGQDHRGFLHPSALSIARGNRCLFLAGLYDAIIGDTHARLVSDGISAGYIQAEAPRQSRTRRSRSAVSTRCTPARFYPPAEFIFLDEAHGAHRCDREGRRWRPTPRREKLLGGTATAQRGDGQPLGDIFERLVVGPSVAELTAQGHLVPAEVLSPPSPVDGGPGDGPGRGLPALRRQPARHLLLPRHQGRGGRHSAAAVPGADDRRRDPSSRSRRSRGLLTRGDIRRDRVGGGHLGGLGLPGRPRWPCSRAFCACGAYLQAVGRALRPSPETGKTTALVLDLTGARRRARAAVG